MFYRVTADLLFTEVDEGADFYHDCGIALLKSVTINPGNSNEERSHIVLQRCFHNEQPSKPCVVISENSTP